MRLYYESAMKQLKNWLDLLNDEFEMLDNNNPINHIKTRLKSSSSIIEKIQRNNKDINLKNICDLTDIVGARIVCNFIDDIYVVINKLKSNSNINIIQEKDYIKKPKKSGYRGYHLIISIPISIKGNLKNIKCEIQIRTSAMDFWASNEHKLNYKNSNSTENMSKELIKISKKVWQLDKMMNDLHQKCHDDSKNNFLKLTDNMDYALKENIIRQIESWRNKKEICE